MCCSFFFNDTATTEIYTLSLHDALPISTLGRARQLAHVRRQRVQLGRVARQHPVQLDVEREALGRDLRSEEHTSELQSRQYLVCRLLLEKKKKSRDSRPFRLSSRSSSQY